MQVVVYSSGSTPTPSPRLHRKQYQGYGRPVLPGYSLPPPHHSHSHSHRSPQRDRTLSDEDSSLRDSIPAMSKPLAITCLICNIILPGLGTFISGLSVLCCSRIRFKESTKSRVLLVNTWVAFLQFVTSFILLLGWIWSIVWGTNFLSFTDEYYKIVRKEKEAEAPDKPPQSTAKENRSPKPRPKETREENLSRTPLREPRHSPRIERNGAVTANNHSESSLLRPVTSSNDSQDQQIIVLQELPVNHVEKPIPGSQPIMNARTRHQKILRRQMSDNQLSPFNLTQEQLEDIVIHAAPITRGRSEGNLAPTPGSSTAEK
ncbi:hypothetical protein FSP39_017105 [Pinctada imbricata]|uniref:Protein SPEC3 n=1 Tax=Pinctada imbricata TaxID=66713 RepID=A0AA88Y0I8_PINIB|nr:hypothetical protein FSP39_017105 [Pinctada imbricata]